MSQTRISVLRNHLSSSKELQNSGAFDSNETKSISNKNSLAKNKTNNYLILKPSNTPSKLSGGTSEVLPNERKKATFPVQELTHIINGGPELTKRRKFIESMVLKDQELQHQIYNFDRTESLKHGVKDFIRIHRPYKDFKPTPEDVFFMKNTSILYGSLNNSLGIFGMTIFGQGNEEQVRLWGSKIHNFEITGSYAQTELGHGSNVRGLETTATYDKSSEEFILDTPTLTAMKWWPGALGKVANHVVLYAQLIIDGKEYGVNVFVVQIRDENHLPLPGVILGDLGNKIGDNSNDTGFMILNSVRIPRTNMLSKYRTVTKEGKYVEVANADPKVHYTTMLSARNGMMIMSAARLAQAATIAIRYSCVRKQGFKDTSNNVSYKTEELKIIDHKVQQYRLFKQLATAYALQFTGLWLIEQSKLLQSNDGSIKKENMGLLKELFATSAGLKSLSTVITNNGAEDLRKCCGGNGYLLHSGIGALCSEYLWQVTAEGDTVILGLMTSKHIINTIKNIGKGKKVKNVLDYFNVITEPSFDLENLKPKINDISDFFNLDILLSWFKYRSILRNLHVAMDIDAEMREKKKTKEEIFNSFANELLSSGQTHCYYIIMLNYVEKIKSIKVASIQKILTRLAILFALSNFLDENWSDIIDPKYFRPLRNAITDILDQIRPDAVPLVDAFDYGDNILKSTIGRYDGNVYEALFDAAQKSVLNKVDPFVGFEEYLKPHTNKELLKRGNKAVVNQEKL